MKWITVVFLLLTVYMADAGEQLWGSNTEIAWGTTFMKTDSLELRTTTATLNGADTIYTKAFKITDEMEGVEHLTWFPQQVDAAFDSAYLDIRYGWKLDKDNVVWGLWNNLFDITKTDSVYTLFITSDSTWKEAANLFQFRNYAVDEDAASSPDTLNPGLILNFK